MKNTINLLTVLFALAMLFVVGCGTLAKDGEYNGNEVLYRADTVITTSYAVFDSFLRYEHENRTALAGTPAIKETADKIRLNAKTWIGTAIVLRDAYADFPTPENRQTLEKALSLLQVTINEATRYLVEATPVSAP